MLGRKKNGIPKKFIIAGIIVIIVIIFVVFALIKVKSSKMDIVKYHGKRYVLLEYKMDIFTYNHNSNNYYEEDMIHPIIHDKWDVVYFNGDLFVLDKHCIIP